MRKQEKVLPDLALFFISLGVALNSLRGKVPHLWLKLHFQVEPLNFYKVKLMGSIITVKVVEQRPLLAH